MFNGELVKTWYTWFYGKNVLLDKGEIFKL